MPINFSCPKCKLRYENIKKEYLGKRIRCHCGQVMRLGPRGERTKYDGESLDDLLIDSDSFDRLEDLDDIMDKGLTSDSRDETLILGLDGERAPKRQVIDDHWNTKQFEPLEPKKGNPKAKVPLPKGKSKPHLIFSETNDVSVSQSFNNSQSQSIIAAQDILPSSPLPPPPGPPPVPPPSPFPGYRSRSSQTGSANGRAVFAVFVGVVGLFECLVVGLVGMAAFVRYGSTLRTWLQTHVENDLYVDVTMRMIVGIVLVMASIVFAVTLIRSILSAKDELQEFNNPRSGASIQAGIAAAMYLLLILIAGGVMMFLAARRVGQEKFSFVSEFWPESIPSILASVLLLSIIPVVVFFGGMFRAVDSPRRHQHPY